MDEGSWDGCLWEYKRWIFGLFFLGCLTTCDKLGSSLLLLLLFFFFACACNISGAACSMAGMIEVEVVPYIYHLLAPRLVMSFVFDGCIFTLN